MWRNCCCGWETAPGAVSLAFHAKPAVHLVGVTYHKSDLYFVAVLVLHTYLSTEYLSSLTTVLQLSKTNAWLCLKGASRPPIEFYRNCSLWISPTCCVSQRSLFPTHVLAHLSQVVSGLWCLAIIFIFPPVLLSHFLFLHYFLHSNVHHEYYGRSTEAGRRDHGPHGSSDNSNGRFTPDRPYFKGRQSRCGRLYGLACTGNFRAGQCMILWTHTF